MESKHASIALTTIIIIGSSSTEFEISGLFRSDLMSLNELETQPTVGWIPLAT